jgi:hypothetical protein
MDIRTLWVLDRGEPRLVVAMDEASAIEDRNGWDSWCTAALEADPELPGVYITLQVDEALVRRALRPEHPVLAAHVAVIRPVERPSAERAP